MRYAIEEVQDLGNKLLRRLERIQGYDKLYDAIDTIVSSPREIGGGSAELTVISNNLITISSPLFFLSIFFFHFFTSVNIICHILSSFSANSLDSSSLLILFSLNRLILNWPLESSLFEKPAANKALA